MRKNFTIEKITIAAFLLTLLLLMLAAFIFYQNALHLQQIQRKETLWNATHPTLMDITTNSVFSNAVFPDSREVFRPELLKTNPINGLQLSIAEYILAISICKAL
jgi:5-methylthioribose kinase